MLAAACSPSSLPLPDPRQTQTPAPLATPTTLTTREGAPDLSGAHIPLYFFCGRSGPWAGFNQSRILAAADMVAAINRSGGIFGAQLDLELVDTGGSAQIAQSAYSRTRRLDDNLLLLLICDAAAEIALAPQLLEDGLPSLTPGLAGVEYYALQDGPLFAFTPLPEDQFAYWLNYLRANWENLKPEGAGSEIRLALVSWPQEAGGAVNNPATLALAAELEIELVLNIQIEASPDADLYDVVYQARDVNANAIYISAAGYAPPEILNALNALGLRERMLVAGAGSAFNASLEPYLFNPAYAVNTYLTLGTRWWSDEEYSAIQFAREIFAGNARQPEQQDAAYLATLGAVDIARRAFEDAILSAGFEDLDADALAQALAALEGYEVLGGLYLLDYTQGRRAPQALQLRRFGTQVNELVLIEDFPPLPLLEE